jgi:hypothetical protein
MKRGDECERYRLAGLVAGLRTGGAVGDAFEQRVGIGLEPQRLAVAGGLRGVDATPVAVEGRLPLSRSMFRQRLVAIRYSQERSAERSSNDSNAFHAERSVSCTASSASCTWPRIR